MKKTFNYSATAEEKANKIEAAKETLRSGIKALVSSEDWTLMLDNMARRGKFSPARFSFGNQILVWCQNRNATAVATYNRWQTIGRFPRKGEKGIMVMQPQVWSKKETKENGEEVENHGIYFKPLYVFDYSQTEGAEVPAGVLSVNECVPEVQGSAPLAELVEMAKGLDCVHSVTLRPRNESDHTEVHGWYVPRTQDIVVITGVEKSELQIFKTLVHEVAHAILHRDNDHHARAEQEVEAESVAYVVSKALGLETGAYSFSYVAHWAQGAVKLVEKVGTNVAKAATKILDALERSATEEVAEAA